MIKLYNDLKSGNLSWQEFGMNLQAQDDDNEIRMFAIMLNVSIGCIARDIYAKEIYK
jgi:hypothetical protein